MSLASAGAGRDFVSEYATEVRSEASLVAYWRLGDPSGTNANDEKGTNDGTYTGGYTLYQTGALAGDPDKSASFDGADGHVVVPHAAAIALSGDLTLEAWVKPVDNTTYDMVIVKGASGSQTYEVRLDVTTGFPTFSTGTGALTGTSAPPTGQWSHIAVTRSGTTVTHYLDGAANGTGTVSIVADGGAEAYVGRRADGHYFSGGLDEVAVYNAALSDTRILAHYNAGV